MAKTATYAQVKRALYAKGTTLAEWSRANGYSYRTALNAVSRHTSGTAREPWGPITRKILEDLGREIDRPLIPS